MYLVDSIAGRLMVSNFDLSMGEVEGFTTLVDVTGGLPDGLAVASDGTIFVAIWGGSEVRRYSPEGRLIAAITMPVSQPSSCAFGQGDMLYITSARANLSVDELAEEPLAGSVFGVHAEAGGVRVSPFAN